MRAGSNDRRRRGPPPLRAGNRPARSQAAGLLPCCPPRPASPIPGLRHDSASRPFARLAGGDAAGRVMITGHGKGERGGRTYCAVPGKVAGGNAVNASPRFGPQAAPVPPGGWRPRVSASQCGYPKVSWGVNGAPFSPRPELDDLGAIAHSPSIVAARKYSAFSLVVWPGRRVTSDNATWRG